METRYRKRVMNCYSRAQAFRMCMMDEATGCPRVVVGSDLTSAGWTSCWFHHRSVLSPRAGRVHHCRDQEGCGRKHGLQCLGTSFARA
ncbi:hypothetical protein HBH56_089050 [Parastagonospora nodorum]|uniref:Uncharacterized protein n=1 Tax=Phaeosphaeria nodorum (strain SN15 / ATCC MYA-4574 / FGSC 10173) TaxID=321614 RepID=A0A7U2F449_PHANO|nr:hypothetical protein HBH56_089050 [Parastagonospora nodorum]QRC98106.1 hypothetical protein JI435_411490 [Parastagonospora nodorum SN15]KAH3936323.1 hypothetical protein HBH54_023690 [Parastagonospora nodorum]KAH3945791.1 hypothetical protein HBH53_140790 [Parastagonospora nodorum]KAH3989688.1 hypothetical protein HBH52_019570 [Parastagonospora nodorum]